MPPSLPPARLLTGAIVRERVGGSRSGRSGSEPRSRAQQPECLGEPARLGQMRGRWNSAGSPTLIDCADQVAPGAEHCGIALGDQARRGDPSYIVQPDRLAVLGQGIWTLRQAVGFDK